MKNLHFGECGQGRESSPQRRSGSHFERSRRHRIRNKQAVSRLGFGVDVGLDSETLLETARIVARIGYDSFWVNDGGTPVVDGLSALADVHRAAPDLALGVGVLPLDRRRPEEIINRVVALGLPLDRLYLGLGAGIGANPVERVRDGVAIVRSGLPTARIFIGALGPRMCRLGGEVADGVLLNWMTPDGINWARGEIDQGKVRSGGRSSEPEVWAYVRGALGTNATERIANESQRYQRLAPHYARNFKRMGGHLGGIKLGSSMSSTLVKQYLDVLDGLVIRALPDVPELDQLARIATEGMRAFVEGSAP